jgi:hypothetical protein
VADPNTCPKCGGNGWEKESGEYALLKLADTGTLQLDARSGDLKTEGFVVTLETCTNCNSVRLAQAA